MLHDFVSSSGLSVFAEIALVIFVTFFAVVCVHVLSRKRGHYDAVARLPLHDDPER